MKHGQSCCHSQQGPKVTSMTECASRWQSSNFLSLLRRTMSTTQKHQLLPHVNVSSVTPQSALQERCYLFGCFGGLLQCSLILTGVLHAVQLLGQDLNANRLFKRFQILHSGGHCCDILMFLLHGPAWQQHLMGFQGASEIY